MPLSLLIVLLTQLVIFLLLFGSLLFAFVVVAALEQLYVLECLDTGGKLTDLGKRMAEYPLDPVFTKSLFKAHVVTFQFLCMYF